MAVRHAVIPKADEHLSEFPDFSEFHCCRYLVDELSTARLEAGTGGSASIERVTIARRTLMSIFLHPDSSLEFQPVLPTGESSVRFSIGVKPGAWARMRSPIRFELDLRDAGGAFRTVYSREIDPAERHEDRRWFDEDIPLPAWAERWELRLRTSVGGIGNGSYCWAVWGDPRVVSNQPAAPVHFPKPHKGHVFLITADALRRDMLGCYGSSTVQTPHIDRLAKDGLLAEHARTSSSTTLGAYTSMLTGVSPLAHGVTEEWGRAPAVSDSLPQLFAANGWHTAMFASESVLSDRKLALGLYFSEVHSSAGVPAQNGEMTTRAVLRRLERCLTPTFFWLQYFDVHPPVVPPEPFSGMYYEGDPADPARRHQEELIESIRGVEAAAELGMKLDALGKGLADHAITTRLAAVVDAIRGRAGSPPDLAVHLWHLEPAARLGMSYNAFADWLEVQVGLLRSGSVSPELMQWLLTVNHFLRIIEGEILTWLEDVCDFRYPVSQYMASVSYFDYQVGTLIAALKEQRLYEDATIIISSPHGEIFDEAGIRFHHHALRESVLRIPMVFKLPAGRRLSGGKHIEGVFDLIDLFPTLAEAFSLEAPAGLQGESRFRELQENERIPPHESYAVDCYAQMTAVSSESSKVLRAEQSFYVSDEWHWRSGETALIDIYNPFDSDRILDDDAALAASELEKKLEHWAASQVRLPREAPPEPKKLRSRLLGMSSPPDELDVTFITANFNRLDLLQHCLRSLQETVAGVSFEVLVVDDCSTDGSADFVRSLQAPFVGIINSERLGFAGSNNAAAARARGRYLCLINNDLVFTPNWFAPLIEALKARPQTGMCGTIQKRPYTEKFDHFGVQFSAFGEPYHYGSECAMPPLAKVSEWPAVTAACCLMRKSVFFRFGGFDEGFRNGYEDLDLCLRMRDAGYRNFTANRSVVYHHMHGSHGRFDHESLNYKRYYDRWCRAGRLMSKVCPPRNYSGHCEYMRSLAAGKAPLRFKELINALSAISRFHIKRAVYAQYFRRPWLFPKALQERFGRA